MYRFLRSPKWILGHVLVLVVLVTFTSLGFWQLRRLDEVRAHNSHVAERLEAEPVPLEEALERPVPFTRVVVTGEYLLEEQVLTGPRSRDGSPGNHVLTPLASADGTVLVDRGWIPYEGGGRPSDNVPGPNGEVRVSGLLMEAEPGPAGDSEFLRTIDPAEVTERTGVPLASHYVQLQESAPAQEGPPIVHADPVLDEGNHLSYAVQWFLFTGVVLVGYPILLWRTIRDQAVGEAFGADGGGAALPSDEPGPGGDASGSPSGAPPTPPAGLGVPADRHPPRAPH